MIVVTNTDEKKWAMFEFLRARKVLGCRAEDFQAVGRISQNTGELVGVVGYGGFVGNICSIFVAGDGNWVSREFIRVALEYPFVQLRLAAIIGTVAATNERSLRFHQRFGAREVHRIANGWAQGVDLIALELKREDCKWVRSETPLTERKAA